MIKALSVASEVFPLVKTGGLADVVGALPKALLPHGVETKTLVPGYPAVLAALAAGTPIHHYHDLFGGPADLVAGTSGDLDLIALDAPHLFKRDGNPYLGPDGKDWPDNWQRFGALSTVAAEFGRGLIGDFAPDILHMHDWQAALAAAYLHVAPEPRAKTILTIHNLAFQGVFPATIFTALRLPPHLFALDGVEYYGAVGYLKAGLQLADRITTVSPTYAEEICTPAGGLGLDGLLRARRGVLTGIVNGVDTDIWNPAGDGALAAPFTAQKLGKRAENKRTLEKRFGLDRDDGILFSVISRLTWQKGMDLLVNAVDAIIASGGRLAALGSGEAAIEAGLAAAAARHPGRVGFVSGYDETLAHLLQGGADAILIPSRFEPCGLTQFHGLHYGCVPVVSRVGGLADTIIDANDAALAAGVATGIKFALDDPGGLAHAATRAAQLFAEPKPWATMQRNGMKADVSWSRSAAKYAEIYRHLASAKA
jgi:starch synthase